jgi:hypothetical protein
LKSVLTKVNKNPELDSAKEDVLSGCKVFMLFGGAITGTYPELKESCRDIFRDIIYFARDVSL